MCKRKDGINNIDTLTIDELPYSVRYGKMNRERLRAYNKKWREKNPKRYKELNYISYQRTKAKGKVEDKLILEDDEYFLEWFNDHSI